jgi:hypothetical protein
MQALADESQQRLVGDPGLEHLHQLRAVDAVEEGLDVGLQDPFHPAEQHPVQGSQRVVRAPTGPKPVRDVSEDRLVNDLQYLPHRGLDDLVLGARDADRSRLAPFLRDVHPPDGLVPVAHRLHPRMQIGNVALQVLPVLLLGDAIHAHRSVLTKAAVRSLQRLLVDEVRQREEDPFRVSLRSLPYLQQSR